MKCIILPYGNAGWTGKKLIIEEVIASRPGPPYIYNDVLILVPSSRMKRTYGKLFLDLAERKGSRALVQPDIQTLHQFLEKHYSRIQGPRLMDEISRLVLLEGLVKERLAGNLFFKQSPDLLAPSLSAALAKMIEQLSAADVTPEDLSLEIQDAEFSDKQQVKLLIDVYTRYRAVLVHRNLTDPAGMRKYLLEHFDPAWLSPYREIIIDGIQDTEKLEAAILRKTADIGTCIYLVDAPSSDMLQRAGEYHPLRIVKDTLSEIGITPDRGEAPPDTDDLFLTQSLFSDRPFDESTKNAPPPALFTRDIRLLSAVNTREEVSLIAGMVKKSLRAGIAPDSILVAFPALDEYGPLVEEILSDYGIPYNRALGRQLGTSPVTTAVVSLLRACQEDFSGPSLLRILSSPFLKFSENPSTAPALERFMRDRRITGGKDKLLAALKNRVPEPGGNEVLAGPLEDLFRAMDPFSTKDTATLSIWMEQLSGLIAWAGLKARVDKIHGPLNINLQAYKKLRETLSALTNAGKLFPEHRYTFSEWLFLLKKTFMHARFQVPPEDEGGVQILGLEESPGHPWQEIYVGGLVDNKFPRRLPQNIFLPERTLETIGVRTLERARLNTAYHFYRLLLSAPKVTLTWPENEGDRPTVPSPFLEELTPLKKAGLVNRGIERTSGIQFNLRIEESHSIPELAKAIGLSEEREGLDTLLSADIKGMSGIQSAVGYQHPEPATGILLPAKKEFWVTELDDYLNCPYDYYIRHVLEIEPLEEVTEDISPLDRGSKVHSILRNFYLSWEGPVTGKNRAEAARLLRGLANSAFDKEADTVRNRREKDLFLNVMAERFLDAEEEFWKQGMRPAYLEQKIEFFKLSLSDGAEAGIKAKVDRIDVDEKGNFIIVDYKTGKYSQPVMGVEQDIFQLPVYAVMARSMLHGNGPALRKPIGLAYYDLAGRFGAGARDVVLYDKDARNDHPSSKPKASPKNAGEFESILDRSMDMARKAIEGIRAGDFTSKPRDESKCRYCANDMMCDKEKL